MLTTSPREVAKSGPGCEIRLFWLVFGNLTRQDWGTVGNNMHYVLYYCLMIAALRFNCFALDTRRVAVDTVRHPSRGIA